MIDYPNARSFCDLTEARGRAFIHLVGPRAGRGSGTHPAAPPRPWVLAFSWSGRTSNPEPSRSEAIRTFVKAALTNSGDLKPEREEQVDGVHLGERWRAGGEAEEGKVRMAKDGSRLQAETRFQKFQRTDQESKSIIEIERDAVRKKTAGLKALRIAKEAAEATEIDKKPAARKKRKPKA